ncbi:MAG: 50S ribosomal protein L23 [Trichlorobacter sp.]|jgi:large subunit ribosomal protein L23|nr:50S ribosomal protein L23 [Trichlorobacter sp.]
MNIYSIVKRPHVTEKTSLDTQAASVITLVVDRDSNKIEIKRAVEQLFKVNVTDVRTVVVAGKAKRFGRTYGKRQNWKKAYVTLKEGQTVDFFEV